MSKPNTSDGDFTGKKERKDFDFEIKEIGEDGSFKGYAAVYGNIDLGGDVIEPFAAKRSLKLSNGKMPILRNHSAKIQDIVGENSTASEDDRGFLVEGKFDLTRESGLDTYKAVKFAKENGRKMGLSIGFMSNRKKTDWIDAIRHLKEIDIVEYSVVVFPMNPKAQISSIKSFCESATDEEKAFKKREIETSLRDAGCSAEERKTAVSAIFALRDEGSDEDEESKQAEEIERKKEDDLKLALSACLSSITKNEE